MTTFIVIVSILFLLLVGFCVYLFYMLKHPKTEKEEIDNNEEQSIIQLGKLDWKSYCLLVIALLLVLASFYSPFIFTRTAPSDDFDFTKTGPIGDTIGGLMNPFIALAGVIVTGLAFYIQYKANLQQRELFIKEQKKSTEDLQKQIENQNQQAKHQQFESQFYEMLKLHRDNITEMRINGYDFKETASNLEWFEKATEGRKVFVTMQTEFECILAIYKKDRKLDSEGFKKCYSLFFSGLDEFEKKHPEEHTFTRLLKEIRNRHENPDKTKVKTNKDRKESLEYAKMHFNYKPFSGHASRLGHYFRHLYLAVKSTVKTPIVSEYKEKMRYLKLLRAQLSNHEQILLFYNWLGEHGYNWENEKHYFFTEYCMIHNLWYDNLLEDDFIKERVNYLRTKKVKYRKGPMFEID
jgi:Ca2+/Na+ antiporter